MAQADLVGVGQPAHTLQMHIFSGRIVAEALGRFGAMRLAERVTAGGERDGLLRIHRHAQEGGLHVARRQQGVGIAARAFGIDVDQAHLDRGQRAFQLKLFLGIDARLGAIAHPNLLGTPEGIAFRLEHVLASAAEAEHRSAHAFDRDVAGQNEQIGPADVLAVLLLDRPQQAPRLVEITIVRPTVERLEPLLPTRRTATPIGHAIGAGRVPGHADHERPVVAIIGRPPLLAVGHQGGEIGLQRVIIERLEGFGIIEIFAHRVGRDAMLMQHVDRQAVWPPILVGTAEQGARLGALHRAAAFASNRVHVSSPYECSLRDARPAR